MKPLPEFRIAANDSTLAHAAAYGRIKQLRGNTERLFSRLQGLDGKGSVRQGVAMLEAHFGKLILMEDVTRLVGSRPKARWLALDANVDGGSDMVAVLVEVNKAGWKVHDIAIRLTSHAVARLMQRTTRSSDLQQFAEVLRYHILAVIVPAARGLPVGHTLTSVSGPGAMIWVPHEDGVRAATWLGVDTMTDPTLADHCRQTGSTKVGLFITKPSGEIVWARRRVEDVGGTSPTTKQSSG